MYIFCLNLLCRSTLIYLAHFLSSVPICCIYNVDIPNEFHISVIEAMCWNVLPSPALHLLDSLPWPHILVSSQKCCMGDVVAVRTYVKEAWWDHNLSVTGLADDRLSSMSRQANATACIALVLHCVAKANLYSVLQYDTFGSKHCGDFNKHPKKNMTWFWVIISSVKWSMFERMLWIKQSSAVKSISTDWISLNKSNSYISRK